MGSQQTSYHSIEEIVGDLLKLRIPVPEAGAEPLVRLNDLAVVEGADNQSRLAQVIDIKAGLVTMQVLDGTKGLATDASVSFLGHPMQVTFR